MGLRVKLSSTNPRSIQPGVVWEFVASTKTASDHLYWGLPNGPGISNVDTPPAYARGLVYRKSLLVMVSCWVAIPIGTASL